MQARVVKEGLKKTYFINLFSPAKISAGYNR
jgi:hypothetical protein